MAEPHSAGEPARAQTMSERMSPNRPSVMTTAGSFSYLTSSYAARSTLTLSILSPVAADVLTDVRRHSREVAYTLALSTLMMRRSGCARACFTPMSNTSCPRRALSTIRSSASQVPSLSSRWSELLDPADRRVHRHRPDPRNDSQLSGTNQRPVRQHPLQPCEQQRHRLNKGLRRNRGQPQRVTTMPKTSCNTRRATELQPAEHAQRI